MHVNEVINLIPLDILQFWDNEIYIKNGTNTITIRESDIEHTASYIEIYECPNDNLYYLHKTLAYLNLHTREITYCAINSIQKLGWKSNYISEKDFLRLLNMKVFW